MSLDKGHRSALQKSMFKRKYFEDITNFVTRLTVDVPIYVYQTIKQSIFGRAKVIPRRRITSGMKLRHPTKSNYVAMDMGKKRRRILSDKGANMALQQPIASTSAKEQSFTIINPITIQLNSNANENEMIYMETTNEPEDACHMDLNASSNEEATATLENSRDVSSALSILLDQPAT
ncbi:hypothetical protein BC833DRAFT_624603, partial [Globomyces pollinis-pini]